MRSVPPLVLVTVLATALTGCTSGLPSPSSSPTAVPTSPTASPAPALAEHGVSAGHPLTAEVAVGVLERGGNAVDAAITAALVDPVLQPEASGLGGGGSAIIVEGAEVAYVDYRDEVNVAGTIPDSGTGVPGLVAGLEALHQRYGRLPWEDLVQPAADLARNGVPVSWYLARQLAYLPQGPERLPQFYRADGTRLQEGDLLVQEQLARTLDTVASEGAAAFYSGDLVSELSTVPGIDAESLAAYEPQWSEPPSGPVGEYELVSASPALPGAALVQLLQVAEAAGIGEVEPGSPEFYDIQTDAWRIANESIQTVLGDPNFVNVPVEELTDPVRNAQLAAEAATAATRTDTFDEVDGNTTHISVVDQDGMAVSMTNTVTNFWGAGTYIAGFFMNDSLERFDNIGITDTNDSAPGARSVSWSAPSMMLDGEGRPALVVGSPGGRQIPSSLATVISYWALHDRSVEESILAARTQLLPNGTLRVERQELADALRGLGYDTEVPSSQTIFGSVQALEVDWNERRVASFADPRRASGVVVASTLD